MAKKRERLEVIYDILKVIQNNGNSVKPTKLLHSSNLSPQMYKEYIDELLSKKFIVFDDKVYSLTKKGFEFLSEYSKILDFIDNFGL